MTRSRGSGLPGDTGQYLPSSLGASLIHVESEPFWRRLKAQSAARKQLEREPPLFGPSRSGARYTTDSWQWWLMYMITIAVSVTDITEASHSSGVARGLWASCGVLIPAWAVSILRSRRIPGESLVRLLWRKLRYDGPLELASWAAVFSVFELVKGPTTAAVAGGAIAGGALVVSVAASLWRARPREEPPLALTGGGR